MIRSMLRRAGRYPGSFAIRLLCAAAALIVAAALLLVIGYILGYVVLFFIGI